MNRQTHDRRNSTCSWQEARHVTYPQKAQAAHTMWLNCTPLEKKIDRTSRQTGHQPQPQRCGPWPLRTGSDTTCTRCCPACLGLGKGAHLMWAGTCKSSATENFNVCRRQRLQIICIGVYMYIYKSLSYHCHRCRCRYLRASEPSHRCCGWCPHSPTSDWGCCRGVACMSNMIHTYLVQWSEDVIKADPFF